MKNWQSLPILLALAFQSEGFTNQIDPSSPYAVEQHSMDQGVFIQANYLFYEAIEDGLDFIQNTELRGIPFTPPPHIFADISLSEPDFRWKSGMQVGIGYVFSKKDHWDLLLNWTYYHTQAKNTASADFATVDSHALRPTWLPLLMGSIASNASVNWLMNFNTLDFSLGRNFFIGRWLSMHLQAGLRAAWINQTYHTKYLGAHFVGGNTIFPVGTTSFEAKWHYHAGGLRFGSDAEWHFNDHFSFLANVYASVLYGKFNVDELFDGGFPVNFGMGLDKLSETIAFNKNYFRIRPVVETEVGMKWKHFFNDNKQRAIIGAYYGLSYWFNQNALVNQFISLDLTSGNTLITNLPIEGNLQLQGLRVELEIDF